MSDDFKDKPEEDRPKRTVRRPARPATSGRTPSARKNRDGDDDFMTDRGPQKKRFSRDRDDNRGRGRGERSVSGRGSDRDGRDSRGYDRRGDDRSQSRPSSRASAEPVQKQENKSLPHAQRLSLMWRALETMSWEDCQLDEALAQTMRSASSHLTEKDKVAIRKGVWGYMRRYRRVLWWLAEAGHTPSLRRSFLVDQVVGLGASVEDLDRNCRGGKVLLKPLTDNERALLLPLQGKPLNHPDMPEEVRHECPDWAYDGLKAVFGERFGEELDALNEEAPLDLRINPFKMSNEKGEASLRDAAITALSKQGWKTEALPQTPYALRCLNFPRSFGKVALYQEGAIEIQDLGSQMVAALLQAQPGERIVDFCAGAGGKSLALAPAMENRGQLVLTDVHSKRLQRSALRLKRAGVFNAERQVLGSERDPWVKYHKGKFHRVLVDAPCSGTGAWRRGVDAKWRKDEEDLRELCDLQGSILTSAARLVRPGGRLVYATCSLLPAENEEQISAFLRSRPDFKLVPVSSLWADVFETECPDHLGEMLRLSPSKDGTDGFFAAVLQREEQEKSE
ncbi:RsmB/NOP family class I SAM-dependent RNA methyltransferase [Kiloniella sp. b19]|uniref:RsmB/NOP family class I SAM-dependent RNA methyltransferase n=1 Tax=Kiloniella sp. GXU_MW_B19 TaxID=3141326 RepID=UPI0031D2572B